MNPGSIVAIQRLEPFEEKSQTRQNYHTAESAVGRQERFKLRKVRGLIVDTNSNSIENPLYWIEISCHSVGNWQTRITEKKAWRTSSMLKTADHYKIRGVPDYVAASSLQNT